MFFSAKDPTDMTTKDIKPIAVLLRGSDEVNPIKLKNVLGLTNPPLLLNETEVKQLTTAMPGSCGPVGLKIPIYADKGIEALDFYIVGANEDDFHLKNVSHHRDFKVDKFVDVRMANAGDACPKCAGGVYQSFRGIEVGHVFYLGTKYSKMMNANYLDTSSQQKPIEMGCYGIGVSRTIQAAVEQSHDADGICWPVSIAPYHVHICLLDPADSKAAGISNEIESALSENAIEVFVDDREERPGVKFKDADLLGMPLRVNIGKRGVEAGELEVVVRKTKEVKKMPVAQIAPWIREWIGAQTK
jgi:prolyl-tRNA synthetase